MNFPIAVDYWRDRARVAEQRNCELDSELIQARIRSGRASAENAAVGLAAHALLEALGHSPSEAIAAAAYNLRAALDGAYTVGINCKIGNAVDVYEAAAVIRRMLARMNTGEKLARAAKKWAIEQMLRKRIDLANIQKWAIGHV